jgi:hypothetical protein
MWYRVGMVEGAPEIEWVAVLAGAKPACRQLVSAADAESLVREAAARGLCALRLSAAARVSRWTTGAPAGRDTLIYVARTEADAAAARAAERSIHGGNPRGGWELGRALGYPECCIDFFESRREWPNPRLRFAALAATTGRVDHRLCNLDGSDALIAHFPCRYDCAPSIDMAALTLDAYRRLSTINADRLCELLRCVGILFRAGGELRLFGTPPHPPAVFRVARVTASGQWATRDRWMERLAAVDALAFANATVALRCGGRTLDTLPVATADVRVARFE